MAPIKIMLVDDNEADIELTKSTLEEGKVRMDIVTASDGQHALDQLEDVDGPIVVVVTGRNIDDELWRRACDAPESFPEVD